MCFTPLSFSHLLNWRRKWVLVAINAKDLPAWCSFLCENIKYKRTEDLGSVFPIVNGVSEPVLKNCITIVAPDTTQWIKEKILMKSQLDAQQKPGIWQKQIFHVTHARPCQARWHQTWPNAICLSRGEIRSSEKLIPINLGPRKTFKTGYDHNIIIVLQLMPEYDCSVHKCQECVGGC